MFEQFFFSTSTATIKIPTSVWKSDVQKPNNMTEQKYDKHKKYLFSFEIKLCMMYICFLYFVNILCALVDFNIFITFEKEIFKYA